jgi:1,4-dihydroxy-2-naphthoate octaprenyltransferase
MSGVHSEHLRATAPPLPEIWWRALRAYSFPASIAPCIVGGAYALAAHERLSWAYLPLVLVAGVAIHVATNLVNDAGDFARGVDSAGAQGGSGVLTSGWLSGAQVWRGALVALAVAAAFGAPLCAVRGWPLAAIGIAGALGGYAYTGPPLSLKYQALGEVLVFLMMGTLMVVGSTYALCGVFPRGVWLASAPVGFLVAAILAANNQRDRDDDARHGIRTLAILLGPRGAQVVTLALVAGAYLSPPALLAAGLVRWPALLPVLTVPLAWPVVRALVQADGSRPMQPGTVERVAALHLAFGLAYAIGLGLSAL